MFVHNNFGGAVPAMDLIEEDKNFIALINKELKTYIDDLEKTRYDSQNQGYFSFIRSCPCLFSRTTLWFHQFLYLDLLKSHVITNDSIAGSVKVWKACWTCPNLVTSTFNPISPGFWSREANQTGIGHNFKMFEMSSPNNGKRGALMIRTLALYSPCFCRNLAWMPIPTLSGVMP